MAAAVKPRLWSLSESGSIVDEDGVSFSETVTGNEGLPGSTSSLERELHDSGIVSSMELLSLEAQDEEGHENHLTSTSCILSEPGILQDSDAYELQESGPLMAAGTCTSLDESNIEHQPFDRNRSMSLPVRGRGARPIMSRRASERALDGLLYTVNIGVNAAFIYAIVSSLLNK